MSIKNITFRNPISGEFYKGTLERGTHFAGSSYGQPVNHIELENGDSFDVSDFEMKLYQVVIEGRRMMTEKPLDFSDLAKQEYKFLIEDLVNVLNDFALTPMPEEYATDYLIKVLEIRKTYDIGRPGLARLHDKKKPSLTILKGGR